MSAAEPAIAVAEWENIEDPPGQRAELLSGVVRMNPAPRPIHQHVVRLLTNALADACSPSHLAVFDAEWRVPAADPGTLYHAPRPDVLVAPAAALRGQAAFSGQPRVVVEVLSPGNRKRDIAEKRAVYFRHGADNYVEVTVSDDEHEVTVAWHRRGVDGWAEPLRAQGDEVLHINEPFDLRIRPNALLF